MNFFKLHKNSISMFLLFELIAVTLWLLLDTIFYLFNFSYIGLFLSVGLFLYEKKCQYYRLIAQLGVGLYMLIYLGIMNNENMMLEGFWYYLFLGVFEAAVIHYAVAKIFGPFLFGRGWCGYACWTAMILDFLPYKTPQKPRVKKLGIIRYILFFISFAFVSTLFLLNLQNISSIMFYSFIVGNLVYYITGIILAYLLKDNRAFCKYICPITVFLKPASYFSILRVKVDENKCVSCGKCKKACPMNVDMTSNSRKRENATECIICGNCINTCPVKALKL